MSASFVRLTPCYELPEFHETIFKTFSQSCADFFGSLFNFSKTRCFHDKCRVCIKLEFLLPFACKETDVRTIGNTVITKLCPELPFCLEKQHHGKADFLVAYISERQFKENGFVDGKRCKRDFYVNNKGRMCSKTDPEARLIRKKGDIIKPMPCDWSNKTHLFMTNGKKFNELMDEIKHIYDEVLDKFGLLQKKQVQITRVDRRKAHNRFQQRNISRINNKISYIESRLNKLGQLLVDGYMYDELAPEFHKLRNRYKAAFQNRFFKYHKARLNISMNTRWDVLDENLDSLKIRFDSDLNSFYSACVFAVPTEYLEEADVS